MNTNHLQSLIALNATRISDTAIQIGSLRDLANHQKSVGDISLSIGSHKEADREQRKLAKAVEIQNALKTELAHAFRVARIAVKTAKLTAIMGHYNPAEGQTSHETEAYLDTMLTVLVPKKVDSRLNIVAAAMA